MSFVFHSKLPMTQKYANHSLFLFVCGSSLNLAIATTTTIFFFPCLFSISLWRGSVPMIENCDCHVSNFPYVGTMLNGTILHLFLHFIVAWVCPWSRTVIVLLSISHLWEPCWMAQFSFPHILPLLFSWFKSTVTAFWLATYRNFPRACQAMSM